MGMPQSAAPTRWTAEMVRALPDDGNRYEVVDGELLVTPAPSWDHQRIVLGVAILLDGYIRSQGLGEAMVSPSYVELDPEGLVQPDVLVRGLVGGRPARGWKSGAPLLLVVERWRPGDDRPEVLGDTLTWLAPGAASPLTIELPPLFARIHGEAF
jgi:Uma2 family endonuclease